MSYPIPPEVTVNGVAFASAAHTAGTAVSSDIANLYGHGGVFFLNSSAATLATATLTIQGKDVTSGQYFDILTGGAVSTVTAVAYKVFPGASAVANSIANDVIPATFRAKVVQTGTGTATYSVSYSLVP